MSTSQRSQMSVWYKIAMVTRERRNSPNTSGETDRTGTVQLLIEPVARYGVLRK